MILQARLMVLLVPLPSIRIRGVHQHQWQRQLSIGQRLQIANRDECSGDG
jgi:hypothetical protein